MSKKTLYLITAIGLFCFASSAFAGVTIPNPLAGGGVNSFGDLLEKIVSGVAAIIASLGTVMIVVAGIFYLTSAGSPERMTKAKTALIYAIAGISIGIGAEAIVLVVKSILGVS